MGKLGPRNMSINQVKLLYDKLRLKYFMEIDDDTHPIPLAKDIDWGWLPDNHDSLAETQFDEDGEPHMVRLSYRERGRSAVRANLLHEMTHMRLGPKYACGSSESRHGMVTLPEDSKWRQETERLVKLGALQL